MVRLTPESLDKISKEPCDKPANWIKVGMSSCGIAAGADEVFNFLSEEVRKRSLFVEVKKCGCQGNCYAEPLVEVSIEGLPSVTYGRVNRDIANKIIEKHVIGKMLVNDCIYNTVD